METLVREAYQYVDEVYGVNTAEQLVGSLKVPVLTVASDLRTFQSGGLSLEKTARAQLRSI